MRLAFWISLTILASLRWLIRPLQIAPATNNATASRAEAMIRSRLTNIFRDMPVLPPFPLERLEAEAAESARAQVGSQSVCLKPYRWLFSQKCAASSAQFLPLTGSSVHFPV